MRRYLISTNGFPKSLADSACAVLTDPEHAESFAALQLSYVRRCITSTVPSDCSQIISAATDLIIMLLILVGLRRVKTVLPPSNNRCTNVLTLGKMVMMTRLLRLRRILMMFASITVSSNGITTALCLFQLSNTFTKIHALNVFDQLIPTCYLFALNVYLMLRLKLAAMPSPTFDKSNDIWVRAAVTSTQARWAYDAQMGQEFMPPVNPQTIALPREDLELDMAKDSSLRFSPSHYRLASLASPLVRSR